MDRITLGLLAVLVTPALAFAHAHLRTASPAVDATVRAVPTEVAIDFSEAVEPRFSSIQVMNADRQSMTTGEAQTKGDAKHLAVAVKPLPAGVYTVFWKATAVDTHKTEGTYSFTVAP